MKMLEFLARDAWIVSTQVGARGMPAPRPSNLRIESDPIAFGKAIASALARRPEGPGDGREYLAKFFGTDHLAETLLHLPPRPAHIDPPEDP